MTKLNSTPNDQIILPNGFKPHPEQIDRALAAQRFTRLYVYVPLGIATTAVVILVLFLLYLALFPPSVETYVYLSGLADFVLIMFMIPVILIFGALLFGGIGGYIYYKYFLDESERPLSPAPPYGRVRTLLWRVDDLLLQIMPQVDTAVATISRPVISFNSWLAYAGSWLRSVKNILLRR